MSGDKINGQKSGITRPPATPSESTPDFIMHLFDS
jgi:hypothetical protein